MGKNQGNCNRNEKNQGNGNRRKEKSRELKDKMRKFEGFVTGNEKKLREL